MGTYRFQATSPNLDSVSQDLMEWLRAQQFTVEASGPSAARVIRAKKTGGLRTMTGTALSFIVALTSEENGQCACEITTDHGVSNVAGAATTALFTGGLSLLTAGMGMAESSNMEAQIAARLELLLRGTDAACSVPPQAQGSTDLEASPGSRNSVTTGGLNSDAVVDGLAKAGGFLWSTAKAIGKGVAWMVSYKCPKCNEADYTKKAIGEAYDDYVGTAYRGLDGQLRPNWSHGATQVQVRYLRKTTTYELICKKCATVWNERSKQEVIA